MPGENVIGQRVHVDISCKRQSDLGTKLPPNN